ncbi:capsule biosynthesis protein [Labrys sp. 22185]|uniref:capsule biosynthesis protein n=1 Tax=Labrys sp. 22185 TaxID=3453888 RepID=UPI003F83A493
MDLKQHTVGKTIECPPPAEENKELECDRLVLPQCADDTKTLPIKRTNVLGMDAGSQAIKAELSSWSPSYLWSFFVFVVIPSLIGLGYFVTIAADQYQSEARFTVRAMEPETPDKGGEGETGPISTSLIPSSTAQDAYIVTNYIRSRAIINALESKLDIREIFQRPEADSVARLTKNASIDDLASYWQRMVDAYVDPVSNIVTVDVTAFRADDAYKLNQVILAESEKLINQLSDRARADAMTSAEKEVQQVVTQLQVSLKALQEFRNKDALIDPDQAGAQIANLLMPLLTERLKLKNEEAVMAAELGADAPSLRVLRNRIASLDEQTAGLRGQLTGNASKTLAASLAKYEELDVTRMIIEQKFARSQAALDRAEARARRQAIYLSLFVPPTRPEFAKYPYRYTYSFMIFVMLLIIWGIGALIHASVEDHRV